MIAKTHGAVRERERERESYTLVNISEALLSSLALARKVNKIEKYRDMMYLCNFGMKGII